MPHNNPCFSQKELTRYEETVEHNSRPTEDIINHIENVGEELLAYKNLQPNNSSENNSSKSDIF